jgi:hypothetical protein
MKKVVTFFQGKLKSWSTGTGTENIEVKKYHFW